MNRITQARANAARREVVNALTTCHGQQRNAAKLLGCSEQALRDWISRLSLNVNDYRIKEGEV